MLVCSLPAYYPLARRVRFMEPAGPLDTDEELDRGPAGQGDLVLSRTDRTAEMVRVLGSMGTAMKITSDLSTPSAVLVVKLRRPAAAFFFTSASSPARKWECRLPAAL